MERLHVEVDDIPLTATWLEANPDTRAAIADALPLEGAGRRWGEELYMSVDVEVDPAETDEYVPRGTVAYWPDGPALCVFWGPTPASTDHRPRAASPVAPLATIDEYEQLAELEGGATMRFAIEE